MLTLVTSVASLFASAILFLFYWFLCKDVARLVKVKRDLENRLTSLRSMYMVASERSTRLWKVNNTLDALIDTKEQEHARDMAAAESAIDFWLSQWKEAVDEAIAVRIDFEAAHNGKIKAFKERDNACMELSSANGRAEILQGEIRAVVNAIAEGRGIVSRFKDYGSFGDFVKRQRKQWSPSVDIIIRALDSLKTDLAAQLAKTDALASERDRLVAAAIPPTTMDAADVEDLAPPVLEDLAPPVPRVRRRSRNARAKA